jgi:hypothetical protein
MKKYGITKNSAQTIERAAKRFGIDLTSKVSEAESARLFAEAVVGHLEDNPPRLAKSDSPAERAEALKKFAADKAFHDEAIAMATGNANNAANDVSYAYIGALNDMTDDLASAFNERAARFTSVYDELCHLRTVEPPYGHSGTLSFNHERLIAEGRGDTYNELVALAADLDLLASMRALYASRDGGALSALDDDLDDATLTAHFTPDFDRRALFSVPKSGVLKGCALIDVHGITLRWQSPDDQRQDWYDRGAARIDRLGIQDGSKKAEKAQLAASIPIRVH